MLSVFPSASHRVWRTVAWRRSDLRRLLLRQSDGLVDETRLSSWSARPLRVSHRGLPCYKELISERECHHQVKELAPSRDESAESKLFTRLSNPPPARTPRVLVITQCAPGAHFRYPTNSVSSYGIRGSYDHSSLGLSLTRQLSSHSVRYRPSAPLSALNSLSK